MFKFSENILKLSSSSVIDEAIKEWLFIDEGQTKEAENPCICQKKVKYFSYMYNYKTKKTIIVGSTCCKKFNFKEEPVKNRLLERVLKSFVRSSGYEIIEDVQEYSERITKKLIELIKHRFEECKYGPKERQELLNEIENLIKEYYMTDLEEIFKEIKQECEKLDYDDMMKKLMEDEMLEYRKKISERSWNTEEPKEETKPKFKRRYYTCYTYGAPIESVGRLREMQ